MKLWVILFPLLLFAGTAMGQETQKQTGPLIRQLMVYPTICGSRDEIKEIRGVKNQDPDLLLLSNDGSVVTEIYLAEDGGKWSIIITRSNKISCADSGGSIWQRGKIKGTAS